MLDIGALKCISLTVHARIRNIYNDFFQPQVMYMYVPAMFKFSLGENLYMYISCTYNVHVYEITMYSANVYVLRLETGCTGALLN